VPTIRQLHSRHNLIDTSFQCAPVQPIEPSENEKVIMSRQLVVQGNRLGDKPDAETDRWIIRRYVLSKYGERPFVGAPLSDEEIHQRGLSRTIGAYQSKEFPSLNFKRNGVQGGDVGETLGDVLN
jgi:hypothetical protein